MTMTTTALAEEHERYEKQLRHSASLDETIRRRNGRIAELEQQLATVREETARRYEGEAAALTRRLEAVEAENARLLASLHEERRQREEIVEALDLSPGAPLDAILRRIESLTEAERGEQEGEPLDLVALPRPEDLPCGYAFQVAEYVSDLADRLLGGAAAPKDAP